MNQRSTMTYDAVGNLKTNTDFNGHTITYSYDPMNRMSVKQFQDGSKVAYTYTPTGLQDVVTFVDAFGVTTATYDYDYDARNRQTKRTDTIGGESRSIRYAYDAASNRTSVITASGTVNYTFDVRNRLDKVIENGIVTADYDYNAVSNLVLTTLANGTQEVRQYDDRNSLKYLENRKDNTVIGSYKYTLDKAGNRLKVEENTGRIVEYSYDDLYRLLSEKITDAANGNRIYDYTYDKVGNRNTKTEVVNGVNKVTEYAYDANDRLQNEKVDQLQIASYTYDNQGNTLTKTDDGITTEYTWDYENRLIAAKVKNASGGTQQSMQYQYNNKGIRVASTVNGAETRYLIDDVHTDAQVLEEYQPSGTVLVSYVYGKDLISQKQDTSRTYYHVDALGSTRVLTDATGNVVSTYNYDAYGEQLNSTGSVDNKYLFAGEQLDKNLSGYYLRNRYYNSKIGRFTRRDIYEGDIYNPATLHKYLYANANPVIFTDPSGLVAGGISGSSEINASLVILAILAAIIAPTLTGDVAETEEIICKYTIDENHIFYPVVYPDRLAGFHSTARAIEGVNYEWVTQPPSNADDYPFSAEYKVLDKELTKISSFFPIDLSDFSVLEIIGDAYVKGGCIPYGSWTGVGTDLFTGVTLPVEGYVRNHHITTAYPGGLPNNEE
jgi:RHS repeat-associated protein